MKDITLTLSIAATALLTLPTLSLAADEKPEGKRPGGPGAPGGHGGHFAEERVKHMTKILDLSQDQQDKLKAIFEKSPDEMKALREKARGTLTEEEKTKAKEFMKKQMEEAGTILTPEQKEKWKAEMEKRRGEGGPRRGGDKPGEKKPETK